MNRENKISFRLTGRTALFSDPITKAGGEKFSYSVPTYQALKGICESIYWKPTFIWYIDRVRIINPIRTESRGIRVPKYQNNSNDLSIYTYLIDAEYQVEAHFEWNMQREELSADREFRVIKEARQRLLNR